MLWFWVAIALLTFAATTLVVWPLLSGIRRTATSGAPSDEAPRLAIYRDRRREIEAERDAGRLTPDEARRSLDELLAEAATQFPDSDALTRPGATVPAAAGIGGPLLAAILAAVLVPLASLVIYSRIGTPAVVGANPQTMTGEPSPQAIDAAIAELKETVRKDPRNVDGWVNLAEAAKMKGDFATSIEAYEKTLGLLPGNARLLADYAEALAMSRGGDFKGKPVELLEKALATDPRDLKALVLMGVAQYRAGDLDRARKLLKSALEGLPPGSEDAQQIAHVLARVEGDASAKAGTGPATAPAATAPAPAASAPPAAGASARPAAGGAISGTIAIDEGLRKQVAPGSILFVVARLPEGPRVPLAVARLSADTWPLRFELGDAQTMDPSRPLSSVEQVVIEARVSRGGEVTRKTGDPFGVSAAVKPGARDVKIRIDQQVP